MCDSSWGDAMRCVWRRGGGGEVDVKIQELTTNPSAAQGYLKTIILCHNQTHISKLFSYT